MSELEVKWIWQDTHWPDFSWQDDEVFPLLRQVRLNQGKLLGKSGIVDQEVSLESALDTILQNIISSSAIEGEELNVQSLRSSLAKRMGLTLKTPYPVTKRSEGLAMMMMDAIGNAHSELTMERLLTWHQWLFPDVQTGLYDISVGQLRGEEPMQVVSGRIDKPRVHFEAPPRARLEEEVNLFIDWFNHSAKNQTLDPLLRAGIVHFWFVTLHPFDDGNGRITRALTDMALAQDDTQSIQLYAMSASILSNRSKYYDILESCQRKKLDITAWIIWFLNILDECIQDAIHKIDRTIKKARFWHHFKDMTFSQEQIKVLNRLLDGGEKGFEQGINASKYQKVAKVSKATATRHLTYLLNHGCLEKLPGEGRNTRYQLVNFEVKSGK